MTFIIIKKKKKKKQRGYLEWLYKSKYVHSFAPNTVVDGRDDKGLNDQCSTHLKDLFGTPRCWMEFQGLSWPYPSFHLRCDVDDALRAPSWHHGSVN
mgnify:FL=1